MWPVKNKKLLIGAALAVLMLAAAAYYQMVITPPKKVSLTFATGPAGGIYLQLGSSMASIWERDTSVQVDVLTTTGALDNIKLLQGGRADLAIVGITAYEAYMGVGRFTERVPLRALLVLYREYVQIVASADKGISTVGDLRGKKVSIGSPGSGTEGQGLRVLEAYGIDPAKDIVPQHLGLKESVDALRDGKIDAFFWAAGIPVPAIEGLAQAKKIELVPNGDAVARLVQKYGPVYFLDKIPKGTYSGQDVDVEAIAMPSLLVAKDSLSDDIAYKLVSSVWGNQQGLVGPPPVIKEITIERQKSERSPIPFHPGAVQFYKEKGVWH